MNLSVGIVGLPNVGKSTLFNALLKKSASSEASARQAGFAKAANYPFTTIEPNIGVVEVPDERLEKLADLIAKEMKKEAPLGDPGNDLARPPIIPAVVKFVDIAGLVKGAASGEGLGNKFLSHIREVDVIVFVLRDFENGDIVQTGSGSVKMDLEVLKSELLLKDLEVLGKRIESISGELRASSQNDPKHLEMRALQRASNLVGEGKWLAESLSSEELEKIKGLQLLSSKKAIEVINCDEKKLGQLSQGRTLDKQGPTLDKNALRICARMEAELVDLDESEQVQYLKEVGLSESGLNRLIKKAYETLSLITFFTAGPKEVRAWTTKKDSLAPQAAGVIHTDFEKGFIAADVCNWQVLIESGSWNSAKTKGLVKTIGKGEVIEDGMVVEFKFNV